MSKASISLCPFRIFQSTPFSPVSPELFIAEPPRGPCRYYNNDELDLDEIGARPFVDLYRGKRRGEGAGASSIERRLRPVAISHLYKLRVDDLRNTIDHLYSLESAITFLNDIKPTQQIDLKFILF